MTDRTAHGHGLVKRLWRHVVNFADAVDVSETSLLADRVTAVERRLHEIEQQAIASPRPAGATRSRSDSSPDQ